MPYSIILFIQLHNQIRETNHLPPLKESPKLTEIAKIRSKEITVLFGHIRPTGEKWESLGSGFRGENLSRGYGSEREVMAALMNSPAHRENILEPRFEEIGVSCEERFCAFWFSMSEKPTIHYYWLDQLKQQLYDKRRSLGED